MNGKWIEIFRADKYPQGNFGVKDLDDIVRNYNPKIHEAPLVVGHPTTTTPAEGWVEALKRVGNSLWMKPKQVAQAFSDMVREGRMKKRSIRIVKTANGWTLRDVGFLGAVAPAVEGMEDIEFSAPVDEFSLEVAEFSEDKGEGSMNEEVEALKTEIDKLKADLTAQKAEFETRERMITLKTEHQAFADELHREGRISDSDVPRVVSILTALSGDGVAAFSASVSMAEAYKEQLKALEKKELTKEFAAAATAPPKPSADDLSEAQLKAFKEGFSLKGGR